MFWIIVVGLLLVVVLLAMAVVTYLVFDIAANARTDRRVREQGRFFGAAE